MTSDELEAWRLSHDLTQSDLARLLDRPLSLYRKWEQGHQQIPGTMAAALETIERALELK